MLQLEEIYKIIDDEVSRLSWPEEPKELYSPLRYMLDIGGKRIRPRFCLTVYNLFSDDIGEHILSPAMAIEAFHSFTLIHDDIMDKADIRRGVPTVYKKWNNNVAILSGDAMCLSSYQLLNAAPAHCTKAVHDLFTKTALQVCEGQQFDMNFETMDDVPMEDYMKMIGLKTGVLIACAASIGALIAGADHKLGKQFYDFGFQLGLAFQIQDDYLDTFGDEKVFGKKIGGDILNNKKTWLLIKCRELAREKYGMDGIRKLEGLLAMGENEGKAKIEAVKSFYRSLGTDNLAEEAIDVYYSQAFSELEKTSLSDAQKAQLEIFASKLVSRRF
ncbi:MAG: polyprenyl synthetase family protein [Bacteroidales bacterium]|nr:polyprenyl synthetase family protein [Bacteroidales bacterium]